MDQLHNQNKSSWPMSLLALGVVFGDIGTSPLYAIRECFGAHSSIVLTQANILGVLSLIVWTLAIVI
jgi:KUP system potassium uptake protein